MAAQVDELDRKILGQLQVDAEQSLDEIARKVGSSKTPVWNRIKRMRDSGIITRTTAMRPIWATPGDFLNKRAVPKG